MLDFEFILTSQDPKKVNNGEYDRVMVVKKYKEDESPKPAKGKKKKVVFATSHVKKESEITDIDLKGLGTDKMPTKERNRLSKIFKKYIKNGVIKRDDAEKLQKDLSSFKLSEEDILSKLNLLLG